MAHRELSKLKRRDNLSCAITREQASNNLINSTLTSFINVVIIANLILLQASNDPQYRATAINYTVGSSITQSTAAAAAVASVDTTPSVRPKPNYLQTGRQITGILDRFMSLGYDKRVRPNYGGPPVEVNVTMRILSISSVSEVMMDFTADFYFRQTWHDPRLSFEKLGDIQTLYVGAEVSKKIWLPDTFFGNEKMAYFHEATTPNVFLRIDHSGEVYRSIRLTVTSSCPMNLQYFPMDRQRCTIEAESYGYNVKDIIYRWARKDTAVEREKAISLPQFDIVQTVQKYRLEELSSGTYSRLIAEIHFARRMGYYLIQIYIPSSLIVVISWVSFWLHRNASPARVQLGVTTVLTMTTLMSSTNAALPKISYVKSIDIFLGTCFVMVFAALLEYATVGYLGKRIAMRKAHAQHAQTQAQARLFAHLQAQGAQGEPVPLAAAAAVAANGSASSPADRGAAGASLGLFGSSPEFPVEPIDSRHQQQHHTAPSHLAALLLRDSNQLLLGSNGAGKHPARLTTGTDQHRHQHQETTCKCSQHVDQQMVLAAPASSHNQCKQHQLFRPSDCSHKHSSSSTCVHHNHNHNQQRKHQNRNQTACSHNQRHAQPHQGHHHNQQAHSSKLHCAHSDHYNAQTLGAEPQAPPRKESQFKSSELNLNLSAPPCNQCRNTGHAGSQTLPSTLTCNFGELSQTSPDLHASELQPCCNHHQHLPTSTTQPPSYCGPHAHAPAPAAAALTSGGMNIASLTGTGASGLTGNLLLAPPSSSSLSPSKGASAAAAAAAATFVNLHRRNKGLPPSTNPNLTQFNSVLNPTYNRRLETIFGIRPSDIDKYSRVVFPVCFVCFQLMYWIVYLHISAFLEPDQHSQQQQQQLQPQQPVTV